MSKPVRLADYLYAQVEELAAQEKRSLANMVQVLLEQALKMESSGAAVGHHAESGSAAKNSEEEGRPVVSLPSRPERAAPDAHFKGPDFK